MEQQIYTIFVTLITVLTSTAGWKFYEKRLALRAKKEEDSSKDGRMFRDDLKDRVLKLETLLLESSKEKDTMRESILTLTAQVSKLQVEVDFLRQDNEKLKEENKYLRMTK